MAEAMAMGDDDGLQDREALMLSEKVLFTPVRARATLMEFRVTAAFILSPAPRSVALSIVI